MQGFVPIPGLYVDLLDLEGEIVLGVAGALLADAQDFRGTCDSECRRSQSRLEFASSVAGAADAIMSPRIFGFDCRLLYERIFSPKFSCEYVTLKAMHLGDKVLCSQKTLQ